ncbi:nucleotidyltransferase domain-containing protein [Nocardioides ferulae]|uniref:nucleotidyltransferase domain-containing protein n=1 Tax=Nocardioides ferulae TaxID=2340821 RepID=UPI001F0C289B|nr:nucleotidyltransferase domain-containing protein [Nocardioides ferulae]
MLAGTESALGVSQIHRLARRGARSGVHRVLDRLTEHGLVAAEGTNLGFVYRLNRDHVLAPAVLSAVSARAEFYKRLTRACEALSPSVTTAALFGSTARRESGVESDIDVLIVIDDDSIRSDAWEGQVRHLEDQVLAWTGNRLECLTLDREHLREAVRSGEPIVKSWQEDAVTLAGVSLPTLIHALRAGAGDER